MDPTIDRIPPHNDEAERSVLGAILLEPEALITASEIILPTDFYKIGHQKIFDAMLALSDRGEPVDVVTVTEQLSATQELENVGGMSYLAELATAVPTSAHNIDRKCN